MGDADTVYAEGGDSYSIGIDGNGKKVVVIDHDVYAGNPPSNIKDRGKFIKRVLRNLEKANPDGFCQDFREWP